MHAAEHEEEPMKHTFRIAVVPMALAIAIATATSATAHEEVTAGDLSLVVGFGTEPAYSGQPNSVEVIVTHDDEPVTDLRPGDLQVEVTFGDGSTTMDLEPNFAVGVFGEPGDYRAWFVPTQPGPYTFHITGTVDDERVDEEVTSGPQTFSDVIDIAEVSFPRTDAPTNDELATRIEQDASRTADALAAADAAAATAADDASSARTTALIAILVGAIGVIAGIAGIATARSARTR
jgi:hypothetical protein